MWTDSFVDFELVNNTYSRKKDAQGKHLPEYNWVWIPQWVINMHEPERWRFVHFAPKSGAKKILVLSPAFVSDCLETTIEIGEEYKNIFLEHGGEELDLVPSLNINADWVNYLAKKIKSY